MSKRSIKEVPSSKFLSGLTRPLKVCAYVRVSTPHEAQINSLENQIGYYTCKLSSSPEYTLIGIYQDAGISGAKEKRPGFEAMLEKAKAGEIDLIYTKSVSRFARNTLLLLETIRGLKAIGVGVIFEEQNINTLSAEGELMLSVLASVAEEERKSVQSNIQWMIRSNYLRGNAMLNASRLLGYDKDSAGNLVINQEQAEIVRRIFQMYLNGLSAHRIAQLFNDEKVPSYSSGPWYDNRILCILSNEKYIGACLMQKSFVDENGLQVRNRGERDQYWMEASHPAIISQEDWDKTQLIRKERAKKTYPFTSLLRCSYCGSALIRVTHQKRLVSWICYRYLSQGKAACPGSRISEARLLELTKEHPITEPVVLKEVPHEQQPQKRRQKNYRFIPLPEFTEDP